LTRKCRNNASDCSASGPGYYSWLWQGFLCVLFLFCCCFAFNHFLKYIICHEILQLHWMMNSFNKTEAAVFSCRLCFLRAFPFISLMVIHLVNLTYFLNFIGVYFLILFTTLNISGVEDVHIWQAITSSKITISYRSKNLYLILE